MADETENKGVEVAVEAAAPEAAPEGRGPRGGRGRGGGDRAGGGGRGGRDGNRGRRDDRRGQGAEDGGEELIEKLVHINRVSKTVKGGKRFGFAALVVVGDGKGRVGHGHGKAREVPEAIQKATAAAKKAMIRVPLREGRTLHHDGRGHFGVADVVTKSTGTSNPYNMIRATFEALKEQTSPKSVAQRRGKKIADLLGRGGSQTAEADAEAVVE
jgi:small subunit ribosomal protein S5